MTSHFARRELDKLISGSKPHGRDFTPQSSLVRFFKEKHLPLVKDIGRREITRYVTGIIRFAAWLGREPLLSDLTLDNLLRFRTWLIEQHELRPGAAHHYPKTLRAIWTTAHRQRLAPEPCRFPELTTPLPSDIKPWKASDLHAMFRQAAKASPHFVGPVPSALWWSAYLAVMLDTGLSHREILDLLWDDVPALKVSPATAALIARLRERSPDLPFAWPFDLTLRDKQTLFATFKRLLIRAGLSATRHDSFERLRKTGRTLSPKERQQVIVAGVGFLAEKPLPHAPPPVVDLSHKLAPTLAEVFEKAYAPLRLIDASASSKKNYRLAIEAFSQFIGRKATTDDLTDINVSRLLESSIEKGNTPATANKTRAMLVSLWNFCAKKRLTKNFPDVPKLKGYYRAPTAWTVEEIGRIVTAAGAEQGTVEGIPAGVWWQAIILTVYDTALRLGAVMKASGDAFAPKTRKLTIRAEWQKQRADQVFTLHADTAALLAKFPSRRKRLFPWSDSVSTFYNRYVGILKRAGLPHGRRDKFHKIRRTTATLAVSLGMDATRQLGHSGPAVTEVYIDRSQLPDTDLANRMPRPVVKGGAK